MHQGLLPPESSPFVGGLNCFFKEVSNREINSGLVWWERMGSNFWNPRCQRRLIIIKMESYSSRYLWACKESGSEVFFAHLASLSYWRFMGRMAFFNQCWSRYKQRACCRCLPWKWIENGQCAESVEHFRFILLSPERSKQINASVNTHTKQPACTAWIKTIR